jgi:hypothetical protein
MSPLGTSVTIRRVNLNQHYNLFGGAVNRNCIFRMFFITITYPLYVSAPTGHLQMEYIYWLIPKELILLQRIHCSGLGYQLYIY